MHRDTDTTHIFVDLFVVPFCDNRISMVKIQEENIVVGWWCNGGTSVHTCQDNGGVGEGGGVLG